MTFANIPRLDREPRVLHYVQWLNRKLHGFAEVARLVLSYGLWYTLDWDNMNMLKVLGVLDGLSIGIRYCVSLDTCSQVVIATTMALQFGGSFLLDKAASTCFCQSKNIANRQDMPT